jgi:uncharacterized protein with PIN domain
MALSPEQIDSLLKMLRDTRDLELTCPECLAELDRYAERTLDAQPLEGVLQRVREHLAACPPCGDEFKLILETLRVIDEDIR